MRRTFLLLLCFCFPLLAAGSAAAEDPAPQPSPKAAYAARIAALPEPSAELGFDLMGVLRLGEKRIGHARLTAAPTKSADGSLVWAVKDAIVIKTAAIPEVEVASAQLDRRLGPLSGEVRSTRPGEGGIHWERTETGYRVFRKRIQGAVEQEEVRNHEVAAGALTTLAATLLFCKLALPDPAKYETRILRFKESFKGESLVQALTLEVVGEETLPNGHKVLVAKGQRGDKKLTALFDPETKAPVGIRLEEPKMKLEILAGDVFSLPATTARVAAMRAGYAFSTGELEVLDDVAHWKSLHKRAMDARTEEEKEKEPIGVDEYRKRMMEALGKNLQKRSTEMMGRIVKSLADQIQLEKQADGTVKATFPAMFQGMKVLVGEEGGIWYMVAMPGAPK